MNREKSIIWKDSSLQSLIELIEIQPGYERERKGMENINNMSDKKWDMKNKNK